jgi:hypothetical protein
MIIFVRKNMNNFKEHIFNCEIEVLKAVEVHQSNVKTSLVRFFNRKEGAVIEGYYTDSYIELVRYLQKLMSEGKLSGQEINNLATLIENYGADIEEEGKNYFFNNL